MSGFLAWLSSALLLLGASIGLIGAIGSKAGALGAALILAGVAAASEGGFALAALFAMLVLLATAPLAAHAMSRAAHRSGIAPITGALGDALAEAEGNASPPHHNARSEM